MRRSTKFFCSFVLLLIASVAVFLYSQGVHLENSGTESPSPSASEVRRQNLAERAAQISDAATKNSLPTISSYAQSWKEALGGVWQAFPDENSDGQSTTSASVTSNQATTESSALVTEAPAGTGISELSAMISAFADDAASANYVSISLGARLVSLSLGGTCGSVDIAKAGAASATSEAVSIAEAARQWFEDDAAQSSQAQQATLRQRVESVSALQSAMLSAGARDQRPSVVPPVDDPTTSALTQLTRVSLQEASQSNDDENRTAILSYACSLYVNDAERESAGALPGSN